MNKDYILEMSTNFYIKNKKQKQKKKSKNVVFIYFKFKVELETKNLLLAIREKQHKVTTIIR